MKYDVLHDNLVWREQYFVGIIFLSTAFRSGTFYYDKICTYLASLKIAISAHLTNKKTTVLLNMTKVGSTQVFYMLLKDIGYIRVMPYVIFRWFAIKLFHWLEYSYSSWIKNASTVLFLRGWLWLVGFPKT